MMNPRSHAHRGSRCPTCHLRVPPSTAPSQAQNLHEVQYPRKRGGRRGQRWRTEVRSYQKPPPPPPGASPGLARSQEQSCTFIFHVSSCCESLPCFPRERSFFTFRRKRRSLCREPQRPEGTRRRRQARRRPYTCQGLLCRRSSWTRRPELASPSGAAAGLSAGQPPAPGRF